MITGRYQDTIVTRSGERRARTWRSNLVVSRCYELVAALMKRQPGVSGVLWWAVGSGQASWDAERPQPRLGDRRLRGDELQRQEVLAEHMSFVDAHGNASATPTSRLEVRGAFRAERFGGTPLREFGLFGGAAASAAASGVLINHVIHTRVDLAPGELLERRLILSFGRLAADADELGGFGAALPVRAIKGVDAFYAASFEAGGVATIGDLAEIGADERFPAIPPSRFREFIEKALAVRRYKPLWVLESLSGLAVLDVLDADVERLIADSGGALDRSAALDAQRALGILQVGLDADVLRRTLVRELFVAADG